MHPSEPRKLTEKAGPRDNADITATGAAESEVKAEASREARPSMTHHQSHHTGPKKLLIALSGSFSSSTSDFHWIFCENARSSLSVCLLILLHCYSESWNQFEIFVIVIHSVTFLDRYLKRGFWDLLQPLYQFGGSTAPRCSDDHGDHGCLHSPHPL